jgi:hypothetical protein
MPPLAHRAIGASAALLAVAAVAVPTASAVTPTDAFKYGYEAFTKYKTCMANIDAGQPCLASDSANIRQILKDVKALRTEIAANHTAVTAQMTLLQKTLDTKVRNDYVTLLNPVTLNVPDALRAWQGMAECADARIAKKASCIGQSGKAVPAADGVDAWQKALVYRAGLMSNDIRSTVAVYTGTDLAGPESGLIASDWLMNKRVQDSDAGATNAAVTGAFKAPVVTAGLGNATTKFAVTYDDYLDSYGMIKPFVAGLTGSDAVAEEQQRDVLNAIHGTDPYSATSRTKEFTLPHLEPRQIAYVSKSDGKAYVVSATHLKNQGYLLSPQAMFDLGTAINAYGTSSTFMQKRPAAFPSGAGHWYPVRAFAHSVKVCPRTETWCPSPSREFTVKQLGRSGKESITTSMHLTNARPTWDKQYESSAYGTMGVNFKTDFAHFVTGPATFDWYVSSYQPSSIGITYKVGPGAWVKESPARNPGTVVRLKSVPPMMG